MPIRFNALLTDHGIAAREVILLRHQDKRATMGRTPYALWRRGDGSFETYQSFQSVAKRRFFNRPCWAAFVVTPARETLFVGLFRARYVGLLPEACLEVHNDEPKPAGSCDVYTFDAMPEMAELSGRLVVEWGAGMLSWAQTAERQNKTVLELRPRFQDPVFPGYLKFVKNLSEIEILPVTWQATLEAARGVYMLSCPRTKEFYVGSATGEQGFMSRWRGYARDGHGGNVRLKSREPADYQVAILQVAGSGESTADVLVAEALWKRKFQSREMGLNAN